MSSLVWSNTSQDSRIDSLETDPIHGHPSNLDSILAAAGNRLPLILPESLAFDKASGKGSTFEVNRELYTKPDEKEWTPYYVAVKHMVVAERDESQMRRHYDSVHRELRVLTHAGLKEHDNILPLLAYGWTNGIYGRHPYLVVEWSDHGTLTEYLGRIKANLYERRELALDVAAGLKALHESKIVHGDMKPGNILVFDTIEVARPQMAKVADFGSSIFELDLDQISIYGGTAMYRAPEQEGRAPLNRGKTFTYQELYQADVYSFGLTVWEILKNGHEYIEEWWLEPRETKLDALCRIHTDENDGILKRAKTFCEHVFEEQKQHSAMHRAMLETFDLSLREEAQRRSNIGAIIEALAGGEHTQRPQPAYPSVKSHPPSSSSMTDSMTRMQADSDTKAFTGYKLISTSCNGVPVQRTERKDYGLDSATVNGDLGSRGTSTVPTRPPSMALSHFHPGKFDLFKLGNVQDPPWEVQQSMVQRLQQTARAGLHMARVDQHEYPEACLQLALCYHIGFGVRPSLKDMFRFLTSSLSSHQITQALYGRLIYALGSEADDLDIDFKFESEIDKALVDCQDSIGYFAKRIWQYQRARTRQSSPRPLLEYPSPRNSSLASIVSTGDDTVISRALVAQQYGEPELSKALCIACQNGDAKTAILICHYCKRFVPDLEMPSPLHWLVMIDDQHAEDVGSALVLGISGDGGGPCKDFLNYVPTAGHETFYFPEHCVEFLGAPLHWAVRARSPRLVQLLAKYGADVNFRWSGHKVFSSDVPRPRLPNLSPLDIAVEFHLPEIVQLLVELGAEMSGGAFEEIHSAFQCIGLACVPFSRYVIHGRNYRSAMKEVMEFLVHHGNNILEADSSGYDPLMVALRDPDCEAYIIEELLFAGAKATQLTVDGSNAAILAARNSIARRYNVSGLDLVANGVADINAKDAYGKGAIHYAAIGGSDTMAEIITGVPAFDISTRTSDGQTALHLAALFGSVDIIPVLAPNHVDMEVRDCSGLTALQSAVLRRKIEVADVLLGRGAEALFPSGEGLSNGSILHLASAGAGSADTILRHLLTTHSRLRNPAILNAVGFGGWTALHKAAYFGDVDAVEALLAFGADKNLRDTSRGPCQGRTTLDKAEELLKQIESRGLGIDHRRIKKRGQQYVGAFTESLKEIKRILESDY